MLLFFRFFLFTFDLLLQYLGRVAHLLKFVNDRFDAAGADQEYAIAQAAGDVLRQFLAGQKLLREDGIFRPDQANAAVKFDRQSGSGATSRSNVCHGSHTVTNSAPSAML
jgi:hypothetical protein